MKYTEGNLRGYKKAAAALLEAKKIHALTNEEYMERFGYRLAGFKSKKEEAEFLARIAKVPNA